MKTKNRTENQTTNKLSMQERYRICIAQDKTRARRWTKHRILKREPLVIAEAIVAK